MLRRLIDEKKFQESGVRMKRKIVRRRRRKALRLGADILSEKWSVYEGCRFYEIEARCNGYKLHPAADTMLEAYQILLEEIDVALNY